MPDLGQAQTGHTPAGPAGGALKSTPKLTRINGDDNLAVIYRNLGNNHAYPFVFADTFTVGSGLYNIVLASGVKWHGYDLATYGKVTVTPAFDAGSFYVTKDTTLNRISFTCETPAPAASGTIDAIFMLGGDAAVEGIYCRGNTGAAPNFP